MEMENTKKVEGVFYNTKNRNHYFINPITKLNLLVHPLIVFFYRNFRDKINDYSFLPNTITIDKIEYCEKEINYYYSKFKYFSANSIFDSSVSKYRYDGKIDSDTVVNEISNLRSLVFEITEQCNLNCKYCGYGPLYKSNIIKRESQTLSFLSIKTIFDYLAKYWVSEYNKSKMQTINVGFYGGEPLLNFEVITKAIDYIEQKYIPRRKFVYRMTTNGLLLNKYMDEIVNNKIRLSVSIDGNEVNHSYRVNHNGENSFNTVFNNLKSFREKYPVYFKENVEFISVIHNRNSMKSTNDFLYDEFKKDPMTIPLNTSGINEKNISTFNRLYKDISTEEVSANMLKSKFIRIPSVRNLADFLVYHSSLFYKNYQDIFTNQLGIIRIPTGTCLPFSKKLYVTSSGKILACEKISHEYELGSIIDGKVKIDPDYIASQFNKSIDSIRTLCNDCSFVDYCFQCLYQLGSTKEGKLVCKQKSKMDLKKYYSTIFSFMEDNPQSVERIYKEIVIT